MRGCKRRDFFARRTTVSEAEWMMAGFYVAALVCGSLFMSTLARRGLKRLEARGH
jgi:hypothetical protein